MFSFSFNTSYQVVSSSEMVFTKLNLEKACKNNKRYKSDFSITLYLLSVNELRESRLSNIPREPSSTKIQRKLTDVTSTSSMEICLCKICNLPVEDAALSINVCIVFLY